MNDLHMLVPGLTDQEQGALDRNIARLRDSNSRNLVRSKLYDGKSPLLKRSTVIPDRYYNLGIALGWSSKAVDALTRRTQFMRFLWSDGTLSDAGMDEIMRDNFLASEITQALTDSALHGISFLVCTRGGEGEPRVLIHAKDALSCTGTWNPRLRRLDDALSVIQWREDDGSLPAEFTLYMPNMTVNVQRDRSSVNGWEIDRSEHGWGVPVEPLVYRPRPSKRYGSSRLTRPIMAIHMLGVTELIRLEGHMDVYAWPEFWLLGGDASVFKNKDGSPKTEWQVMLGRIKGLNDNMAKAKDDPSLARADVKQFPASSPSPHIDDLDMLSRMFAREASLPDSAVALKGMSNPTAEGAYDASQYELLAEAEGAMRDWDTPLARIAALALAIKNGDETVPDAYNSVKADWLGARYESRAAKADAGAKQLGSVPWLAETEVGLELLGLEPEQIKRALVERKKNAGRDVVASVLQRRQQQATVTDDGSQ